MRLEAVGKRYGLRQPWVVRDVTADVPAGRLIRVAGRNGSGKSTLLRVVAGVSRPSAGKVTGRPHCGYVPERFPGDLPFSGREYLVHLAGIHGAGIHGAGIHGAGIHGAGIHGAGGPGLRGAAGRRRVEEWLERLGAAGYADQPLRSMSKGMCQKVALVQALLPAPGLLVLDEAWTGLDQAARAELDAAVTERVAAGGTVLFVDHDPARLAGQEDERWDFDGAGRVAICSGPAPVAAPAETRGVETVTIRLETADAGRVIGQVRAIDGARLLSVDVAGTPKAAGTETAADA